jgi:hypothetical protein
MHHPAAHDQRKTHAQDGSRGVDAERARALFGREAVGDHRIRRGRQAGLADPDADTREEQRQEVARHAARCGRKAPERQAGDDEVASRAAIREPRERDPHHRVEERECETAEQAELRVRDAKIPLHGLDQQREDLPVDKGSRVGRDEQQHHGPGSCRGGP